MSRYRSERAGLVGIVKDGKRGRRYVKAEVDAALAAAGITVPDATTSGSSTSTGGVSSTTSSSTAAAQRIRLEGPVTGQETNPGSGLIPTTITLASITDAMLADMPEATVKGRAAGAGAGPPTSLNAAAIIAILALADGSGSGLDADTLDGYDSAAFPRKAESATIGGAWTFSPMQLFEDGINVGSQNFWTVNAMQVTDEGATSSGTIYLGDHGNKLIGFDGTKYVLPQAQLHINGSLAWNAGNDGAGSGLDADTLDGLDSSAFQPIDADLTAIAALAGTGIAVRTAANTWAQRSIVAGNQISVTNGDGVSGNITIAVTEGAGSGLDADTLDGYDSSAFGRLAAVQTWTQANTFQGTVPVLLSNTDVSTTAGVSLDAWVGGAKRAEIVFYRDGTANGTGVGIYTNNSVGALTSSALITATLSQFAGGISTGTGAFTGRVDLAADSYVSATGDFHSIRAGGTTGVYYLGNSGGRYLYYDGVSYIMPGAQLLVNGGTVWHSGNDGAGSGLDADLLDGVDSASYYNTTNSPGGTYTPTLTNTFNVFSSGAAVCSYQRIGNNVIVSGRVTITPSATGLTRLDMTLPIASNLGSQGDLGGCAAALGGSGYHSVSIYADTAGDKARFEFNSLTTAGYNYSFMFMYRVI